jgi:hypothetical protein
MAKKKTVSKTSPKGGKRGCLCDNGTYDSKCCDGSLQAQGIGSGINEGEQVAVNIDTTRVITFN